MPITTVLFDLDGTLLPMEQDGFIKTYFSLLVKKIAPLGYEPTQLVDAIWAGTAAMMKNDGSRLNADVFWQTFAGLFGENALAHRPLFDEFYQVEFQQAQATCRYTPKADETVKALKDKGYRIALATNPVFPRVATASRMRWAGLDEGDFEVYTTYENSRFGKPNPRYFQEVAEKMGVAPENCLMVGNDIEEDMVAATAAGMQVFLLSDCMINKKNRDLSAYPQGSFDDLIAYLS